MKVFLPDGAEQEFTAEADAKKFSQALVASAQAERRTALAATKAEHRTALVAARAERRAEGPTARLRALSVGESVLLTQYRRTSQVSALLQALRDDGLRFSCARERSLAAVEGVRVLRTR